MNSNPIQITIEVDENQPKQRIDQFVAHHLKEKMNYDLSRSVVQNWIEQQLILVNGKPVSNKTQILPHQVISIDVNGHTNPSEQSWQPSPIQISFEIVYEDDELIIINKPAGLVVHPGAGHHHDTLINELLFRYSSLADIPRNGVIHRLDKDTSGLICVAKTSEAHQNLTMQMNQRAIEKIYLALVNGNVVSGGTIDLPIMRSNRNRKRQVVHQSGREAQTEYWVEHKYKVHTLLRVNLLTGRTHQIRVHLSHIGFPIVGDSAYSSRKGNFIPKGADENLIRQLQSFKRQALHAHKLKFTHPSNGKILQFEVALPADFQNLLQQLKEDTSQSIN